MELCHGEVCCVQCVILILEQLGQYLTKDTDTGFQEAQRQKLECIPRQGAIYNELYVLQTI